jgi:hypothetical protein
MTRVAAFGNTVVYFGRNGKLARSWPLTLRGIAGDGYFYSRLTQCVEGAGDTSRSANDPAMETYMPLLGIMVKPFLEVARISSTNQPYETRCYRLNAASVSALVCRVPYRKSVLSRFRKQESGTRKDSRTTFAQCPL